LPVVLYGCETWYVTLKEERRLRNFENRVLRRIFGSKRDEVTVGGGGGWRRLHSEELYDVYSSQNKDTIKMDLKEGGLGRAGTG
jgi:hypothetical protein